MGLECEELHMDVWWCCDDRVSLYRVIAFPVRNDTFCTADIGISGRKSQRATTGSTMMSARLSEKEVAVAITPSPVKIDA